MISAYKGLNTYCSKLGYGRQDKLYALVLRFVTHTECRLVTDQHNQLLPEAATLSWIAPITMMSDKWYTHHPLSGILDLPLGIITPKHI